MERIFRDPNCPTKPSYTVKGLLGKGGFAKCYEVQSSAGGTFACKVIEMSSIQTEEKQKKVCVEIAIHQSVNHPNIVKFIDYFRGEGQICMIIDLCNNGSLGQMLTKRRVLTEPEIRFMVKQIALGCDYLHSQKIIHRDLKPDNVLLDDMQVKLSDFGLSKKLQKRSELVKTWCGTTNYMSPEVLRETGYSYGADVWSLGCTAYTMFAGKPPFDAATQKGIILRILRNDCDLKSCANLEILKFIQKMLKPAPEDRLMMKAVLEDDYLKEFTPPSLSTSCLTQPPVFPSIASSVDQSRSAVTVEKDDKTVRNSTPFETLPPAPQINLGDLIIQLKKVLSAVGRRASTDEKVLIEPALQPIWVAQWTVHEKVGLGFRLTDQSVGVHLNNSTNMILLPNGNDMKSIKNGTMVSYKLDDSPPECFTNTTLFTFLKLQLGETRTEPLLKTEGAPISEHPTYVKKWNRSTGSTEFHLSNESVQISFLDQHSVLLCPYQATITLIEKKTSRTYSFELIEKNGCTQKLKQDLEYSLKVIKKLAK